MGNKRRFLVAGGTGFLGSHLSEALLDRGESVVCLDNFSSGSRANIQHLVANKDFLLLEHDIVEPFDLEVSHIYNLACPASPLQYQADPLATLNACVLGTRNLLDLANRWDASFVLASTSEVYGNPAEHPQGEAYFGHVNPSGPRSCYEVGKRCAEVMCMEYRNVFGTKTSIGRLFNTYGPRMNPEDGRSIPTFLHQSISGRPLTVFGDGTQTRSFCYVDDMIEGLLRLMAASNSFAGPVNLGNPDERSILEVASLIVELAGSLSTIVHHALPIDDPVRRCPDISLARRRLKWSPTVTLEEGLARTIRDLG